MKFLTLSQDINGSSYAIDKDNVKAGWYDYKTKTLHIDPEYKFYMELCQKCEDENVKWQDIDKTKLMYGRY